MRTFRFTSVAVLLWPLAVVQAADLYVAPSGRDTQPGTREQPLATIQAAVNLAQPGYMVLIRGGTYRETVTFPRSGTADKPITLKPYRDEKVLVSGCAPVTGWTLHDPTRRIWKASMPWTLGLGRNQVFCNGQVLIEARHPNAAAPGLEMVVADLSPLWPTYGEFSIPKETRVSQPGRIVSKLLENQPDNYWKGALYCGVHFEGWCAQTGVIESSTSGEMLVGDCTQGWWFGSAYDGKFPQEHELGRGMIVEHMHALDAPGEWHWQDNTLYLIAPDGGEPREIEVKRRQLAFDLSGREHIHIEGLTIRAASLRLENTAHCVVDRCDLAYIAHYTRHYGIGQIEKGRDTIKSGETGIFVGGHDNAFLNCSVRFSAGTGFHVRGYHHTIHNCLIDEVSYVGHYLNAITDAVSDFGDYEHFRVGGHVITFNTMRNAGRHFFNFYGNGPSLGSRDRGPMDYAATLFAHNHLYNGMLLTRDAGFLTSFYASGGTLNDQRSQVAYNVMHDCYDISAMRWNKLGMVYLDNGSREVDVHHNLLWAAPGSLQSGLWFNPPNINVSDRHNIFHGLFTRTSAELRNDDFPEGKPFRFGHDFDRPPTLPHWPQLATFELKFPNIARLMDGASVNLGNVDFNQGWQSAVLRFASDAKGLNTDRSTRAAPRHQKAADPLVLDAKAADGSAGMKKNWIVFRAESGAWMKFSQVPLAAGYRRFRAVYGTTHAAPRRVEVRLDRPDGPLVGQASLPPTDRPRLGSIQMFEEAVGDLTPAATGTHDVYFIFVSDDGKSVAEFEYFRMERARQPIALPKNDVRVELRLGGPDGETIGQFVPRFTGGDDAFRDLVAKLEPARGAQRLFLVVRSALAGPIGRIDGIALQKASPLPTTATGVGIPPLRAPGEHGKLILPAPTNRPCASPADRYREASAKRPFFRGARLTSLPAIDGVLKEWAAPAMELKQSLEGATFDEAPARAWFARNEEALYVAVRCPIKNRDALSVAGHRWGATDGVEIALQDAEAMPRGPILSLRGWPDGHFQAPDLAGVPAAAAEQLAKGVVYCAAVDADAWTCEWRISLKAARLAPATSPALLCNVTVRNAAQDTWRTWHTEGGATYDLHNGGTLFFSAGERLLAGALKNDLELWLDAADAATIERDTDGRAGIWKDRSGKGRHAVQKTADFRPFYRPQGLNGKATLQFDDAKQTRLELPDLADRPITATIFAVVSNPEAGQPQNHNQRVLTASNGMEYDYLCGLCCQIRGKETDGPRIITYDGKDRWAQKVRVGCFSPKYQTFFHGQVSEILVYSRPLTPQERQKVTMYLMDKWGL